MTARAKDAGLAIETATAHVEVAVLDGHDTVRAHRVEEVGHGHTRRLAGLIRETLAEAQVRPAELAWVAADLGPGSFTGVRVGLASAEALALASGATLLGASSLAALAHGARLTRTLVVPLVPAGRRDTYAGFFRADARGGVRLLAAPTVGPIERVRHATEEALGLLRDAAVQFVGPGVARERDALEAAFPGSTASAFRAEGLSALDLAHAARLGSGAVAGLPEGDRPPRPLYVRGAQAEERVRRAATRGDALTIRPFRAQDLPAVAAIERATFADPWPESFFRGEIAHPLAWARVAERDGVPIGYLVAWIGHGSGHLGNLAVVQEHRRRGIARRLVEDLLAVAEREAVESLTLEVRVSNDAAQALYHGFGFRLAGLRRGYYRDNGEDALVMEWRPGRAP